MKKKLDEVASNDVCSSFATALREAEKNRHPIDPFAEDLGQTNIEAAYRIQHFNTEFAKQSGRSFCGRKIGLTSEAVQRQLGVSEPDYGALFQDMQIQDNGVLKLTSLIHPRIEAEIALIVKDDVTEPIEYYSEAEAFIDCAICALEIVDSRLRDWKIGIVDTIADNGASARFVLGQQRLKITSLELAQCSMSLTRNGQVVSQGKGVDCMGHPFRAFQWLANRLIRDGYPLLASDMVLTGALGPVCEMAAGDTFQADISGLGAVSLRVAN